MKTQEQQVLAFLAAHPRNYFTREEIHKEVFNITTPYTSVQRAITNLKQKEFIEKAWKGDVSSFGVTVASWGLYI